VSHHKTRTPEDRGSNRKVIIDMSGQRELVRIDLILIVDTAGAETRIRMEPVVPKIEAVLDEKRTAVCIVSDAVSAYPRIN
jgi:hypothetical protein